MTTKDDKEPAAKMANDALHQSDEDLLQNIFRQYWIAFSKNDPIQINRTLAYFSALLIKLSRQAEESTKKIVRLTWALLLLTAILLVVAVLQIIIFKQDTTTNSQNHQTTQDSKQVQTNTKPVGKVKPIPPVKNETHK